MKKTTLIFWTVLMIAVLAGCGNKNENEPSTNNNDGDGNYGLIIYEADEYNNQSEYFIDQFGIKYQRTSTKNVKIISIPTKESVLKLPDQIDVKGKVYNVIAAQIENNEKDKIVYLSNSITELEATYYNFGTIYLSHSLNNSFCFGNKVTIYSPFVDSEMIGKVCYGLNRYCLLHSNGWSSDYHCFIYKFNNDFDPTSITACFISTLYVPKGYANMYISKYEQLFDKCFEDTFTSDYYGLLYNNKLYKGSETQQLKNLHNKWLAFNVEIKEYEP